MSNTPKETDVKRIYWEEDPVSTEERMIFELADGRKLELAVYGDCDTIESAVSHVGFQQI